MEPCLQKQETPKAMYGHVFAFSLANTKTTASSKSKRP
jgi:hypothetical protein